MGEELQLCFLTFSVKCVAETIGIVQPGGEKLWKTRWKVSLQWQGVGIGFNSLPNPK